MSRVSKVKEQYPEADASVWSFAEQADQLHDLRALADTDGAKQLTQLLMRDAVDRINVLRSRYTELTHTEFIAHCAALDEKLTLARLFLNAEDNLAEAERQLEDALQE